MGLLERGTELRAIATILNESKAQGTKPCRRVNFFREFVTTRNADSNELFIQLRGILPFFVLLYCVHCRPFLCDSTFEWFNEYADSRQKTGVIYADADSCYIYIYIYSRVRTSKG